MISENILSERFKIFSCFFGVFFVCLFFFSFLFLINFYFFTVGGQFQNNFL